MDISNAYFAAIIQSLGDAVIGTALDGVVTTWNPAAELMFGHSAEEMIGQSIDRIIPPELVPEMHSILARIKQGERIRQFETVRRGRSGALLQISLSISPILNEQGEVVGAAEIARDISERLRAVSKLAAMRQRYGAALQASQIGTWHIDWQSRTASRDAKASQLLGLPEDASESTVDDHVASTHPEDRARVLSALETAARQGAPYLEDYRVVGATGEVRWVRDRGGPDPAGAGTSASLTGCVADITEQTAVGTALAIEHARLQSILDRLPVGVVVVDLPSRQIALWNPAAEQMLGHGPLAASLDDDLPLRVGAFPDGRPYKRDDWPVMRTIRTGEAVVNEEIVIRRAEGTARSIMVTTGLIPDDSGTPVGVLATYDDITDRQHNEERYRLMFETSPIPLWVYDNVTLEFLAVNQAAIDDYGYSREEFLAMTIRDIRPTEDVDLLLERISLLEKGYEQLDWADQPQRTWRHRRKDGSVFHVDIRSHDVEFDGHRARMVMSIDVTARQKLEEQLRQAQKMEAIGQLAGGIAHDFNNLLTVIGGYANLALMGLPDGHGARAHLTQVVAASERAAALTHQLLAFGRKQVLQPRVLHLNTVIDGMRPLLARLLREDILLELRLDPALCQVEADPHQLELVLMNLVINASDAMKSGGLVTIETKDVFLDEEYVRAHLGAKAGHHAMLAVSDTGHGMDAATQARIFEPFFTTKPVGKGTGLGLSTAFGIVKQSGGHIGVYSEVDVGSTFKVYLPTAGSLARVEEAKPEVTVLGGTETILLVEDDAGVRDFSVRVLRQLGYTVHEATNGEQALRLGRVLGDTVDLLLTDVVMPTMGGRQLSEALAPICRKMRVLFMSGYTQNAIVQHGVLDPGLEFIAKPFHARNLAERVRQVLSTPLRPRSVLLLEGDAAVSAFLCAALEQNGYSAALASEEAELVARCRQKPVDLVVIDVIQPVEESIQQIQQLTRELPHVRRIIIAGNWDERIRKEARRAGADECLEKPVALDQFLKTIRDLIG
ncbi:PAS domain S-box protein [uncultured Paludibaculum sp.]|uniref:hybrid sensor histidine kinase/response regulator n=1 Tax=uncultured Paludibaculum sp. TaxID=1765020 RepID=UPI002AAAD459|nr:PAS domain S-box protein [uncultured Paludibaculum sp.]